MRLFQKNKTHNIIINIAKLKERLIPDMIEEKTEKQNKTKCENCDGTGIMRCNLGFEHDCDGCNSKGIILNTISELTGKKIEKETKLFKLYGVFFLYFQLKRLVNPRIWRGRTGKFI